MKVLKLSDTIKHNIHFNQSIIQKLQGPAKLEPRKFSPSNQRNLREKIHEIFLEQFNDNISFILLTSEAQFIETVSKSSLLFLKDIFKNNELNSPLAKDTFKSFKKHISNKYLKIFTMLNKAFTDYSLLNGASKASFPYIKSFLKHCADTDDIAYHRCSDNKRAKLIGVYSPYNSSTSITHVLCWGCKKCFPANSVVLYCDHCSINYNSYLLSDAKDEQVLFPATWMKYHCGNKICNGNMMCLKCSSILYLNIKTKKLCCTQSTCWAEEEQGNINWNCQYCKKNFKSKAKIYNHLNIKIMKKAIKKALIWKKAAKPKQLNCCQGELGGLKFYHKENCQGRLFAGEYNDREIIVCDKCNAMNFSNSFVWTCPICKVKFRNREIEGNENRVKSCMKGVHKKKVFSEGNSLVKQSVEVKMYSNRNVSRGSKIQKQNEAKRAFTRYGSMYKMWLDIMDKRLVMNQKEANKKSITRNKITINHNSQRRVFSQEPKSTKKYQSSSKNVSYRHTKSINSTNKEGAKSPKFTKTANSFFFAFKKQSTNDTVTNSNSIQCNWNNIFNQEQWEESRSNSKKKNKKKTRKLFLDTKYQNKSSKNSNKSISTNSFTPISLTNSLINYPSVSLEQVVANSKIPICNFDVDYKIKEVIGEGSYSKIYLIQSTKTNHKFAMKKIIADNMKELLRLQNEFELVYTNHHDNIMNVFEIEYKVLDFSTYAIYVVMELARYDWDHEIKAKKAKYKENEWIKIIFDIAKSLIFLKERNISHRDIKPQNIWIFDNWTYKLADFGEAKENKIEKENNTLRGTELYMSPWLYQALYTNEKNVKHDPYKSDVFSLGYCLWYAACWNIQPWYDIRRITEMSEINNIVHKCLKGEYSELFIKMVIKMLETEEGKRFSFEDWLLYIEHDLCLSTGNNDV